ncbi:unnamed protein product [Cuscuta europaea]|uniref:Uncharacterized protein n=1 Tax=Cuscuta europaea TaxID=41803 RepID=A0A9P0Z2Q6_CUSEU|nr:unnamed protein product [Cuscuta europaea]
MSTHKRGVDWRYNEDIFLCNSWVSIYEDGAVGNINQTGDSFWFRVHMFFCQKANAIVRTEEAVESGFKLPIISVLYGRGVCEKQMQPLEVDPIQWMWVDG